MIAAGTVAGDKYQVLSLIGEGGMARVWLVRDLRLNKLWALKEMREQSSAAETRLVRQRLEAEALIMRQLDHRALPRVVDLVEDPSTFSVVMDYVEGETLAALLQRRGRPFDQEDVVDWGLQLADVLGYLHSLTPPIIYRDMKPGNVILQPDGQVKLIDLGIARRYKPGNPADTVVLGTRGYAAPEQFDPQGQSDARTDIYALGVTLYRLITGHGPDEQPFEIRPIRTWDPTLSEGLEKVIWRCTRPDPEARYQSCAELSFDLAHHEQLTRAYRRAQEAKLKRFAAAQLLAAALLACGALLTVGGGLRYQESYEELLSVAAHADPFDGGPGASSAELAYRAAVDSAPERAAAYQGILDTYQIDGVFTQEEAARWQLLSSSATAKVAGRSAWAGLCYQTGMLYLVYADFGDEAARGALAATWFESAARGWEGSAPEKAREARAYALIGRFDREVVQATLEGGEVEACRAYWEALEEQCAALGESDAVAVRLRLYQLGFRAVSSPAYLEGFRRAGVDGQRAAALLELVERGAASCAPLALAQGERLREICEEITTGALAAEKAVRAAYGPLGEGA